MNLKALGIAAVAAMAFTAFAASSASATTLEVGGVAQNNSITITFTKTSGHKAVLARTDGSLANECTSGDIHISIGSPFTGTTVTGPVSTLSFSNCTRPVTVHKGGTMHFQHIASTTNGTVSSSGAEVTVGSPFGTLNCKTGEGVDLGTLTGTASGHPEMDVSAVLNCGFLVPSATLKGVWTATSPTGLGVVA